MKLAQANGVHTYGSEKFQNTQRYVELSSMLGNVKFILTRFLAWSLFEVYSGTFLVLNPIWAERMSEADCVGCR